MPGPFSTTVHVVDKQYAPGSGAEEFLSIELTPDGFSFAVIDERQQACRMLVRAHWNESSRLGDDPSACLNEFVQSFAVLQHAWSSIQIAWFSSRLTLVPERYYSEDHMAQLSGFCNARKKEGEVYCKDDLPNLKAYGLYMMPQDLHAKLQQLFPAHRLRHSGSILIESILSRQNQAEVPADMVLYFRKSFVEMLLFNKQQLTYYKAFSIQTTDDLMYYLFYVLQLFGLDHQKIKVECAGTFEDNKAAADHLWSYFRQIGFADWSEEYRYSASFEHSSLHAFYTVLHHNK